MLIVLVFSMPLYGEVNLERYFSLSLEEILKVKVTGSTLTPMNLKTVPAATTVFNHKDIKRMGLDSLDELMNLVPGFQSYRTSFASQHFPYSSRGRRISAGSSEILLLVDGHRLEESAASGSGEIVPKFPLWKIDRVEFIRGPGAAVYGSNAMMGVINIITRSNINEASISVGSFGRVKTHMLTTYHHRDVTVDAFLYLDTDNGDDYKVLDTFSDTRIKTDDPSRVIDLNLKASWKDTYLSLYHTSNESSNFYTFEIIANGVNENRASLSSLNLKHDFNWSGISSWLWLSYSESGTGASGQSTKEGELGGEGVSNPSSNDALVYNFDFDGYSDSRFQWHSDWYINRQQQLQFGIEVRKIQGPDISAFSNFDVGALADEDYPIRHANDLSIATLIQNKSNRDILGLYGQHQYQLSVASQVTFSLRYDKFFGIGSQLSPRLGLVHEINANHSVKVLYGQAFRAPTENELNLQSNSTLLGNKDLQPETVHNLDLIWVAQWSNKVMSFGYFESHFKDSIVQVNIGGSVSQYQNIKVDPVKGIEFELSHYLNDAWMLRTSYTHIIKNSALSLREANHLVSFILNYQLNKFNGNLVATYHGERSMPVDASTNLNLDAYWQLFGKLSYQISERFEGYIQVKNIQDKQYLTPSSDEGLSEGVPNRGREILTGVSFQF